MRYEDHRPTFAMLNILLIGPSGIGKSTSVSMAKALLPYVPQELRPGFISGSSTKEKLHADLVIQPHTIIFASELATLFSKEQYKEGLIGYVTNLLDYDGEISIRTKKEDLTIVENPEVVLIGASTREWLTNMLPDTASTGGFLPRFIPVLEDQRGQRMPNPRRRMTDDQQKIVADRREAAYNAFTTVALSSGELDWEDSEAASRFNRWYDSNTTPTGGLAPFYARAAEMVLRMAMLFSVSCRRLEITEEDTIGATKLYGFLKSRFADITVATTPAAKLLQAVRDEVTWEGTSVVNLYRNLTHLAGVPEIQRQINSLIASEHVRQEENIVYRVR